MSTRRFISIDAEAPPGFEHVAAPGRRELRAGVAAIWAPEPAALISSLGSLRERVRGVVIHAGASSERERLGPSLWSFGLGDMPRTAVRELAGSWLDLCEVQAEQHGELQRTTILLEREQTDRQRLAEKVNQETTSLRDALLARTKWTAEATGALVHFVTEELVALSRTELPAALVEFLTREPMALANARMFFARGGSWHLEVERWAGAAAQPGPATAELPEPGSTRGVTKLGAQALLVPIAAGDREALVVITRPRGFDEAEVSLLGLVSLEIDALYRRRRLNAALSKAVAERDAMIEELSTPIIRVWRDTVCLPIIGSVDEERATRMASSLLDAVAAEQLRYVILDFTGLSHIDTQTVAHFTGLARAIRLLGARCMLSGVSASIARTLVGLGVDIGDMPSLPSVAAALARRMDELVVSN